MEFKSNNTAFGRHETFPLRYGWLTKGFHALKRNPKVFESDESTVTLGVGKNMVGAIRYWLRATQMIEPNSSNRTRLGDYLLSERKGKDPYLEDEATIWLIHWLLATDAALATTWFWFFNKYHKTEFNSQELLTALTDFVRANVNNNVSAGTLKNDVAVITRMYAQSKGNTRTPIEDALDSPLSLLGLITQASGGRIYQSRPEERPGLPTGIFGFAVSQLMIVQNSTTIPIEELMYSRKDRAAPGAIFRLTENDLLTKLEKLVVFIPGYFEIRETAGIHQLYLLKEHDPLDYLEKYYLDVSEGLAA